MAVMRVYHGGYMPVEKPEIREGQFTKDFGKIQISDSAN